MTDPLAQNNTPWDISPGLLEALVRSKGFASRVGAVVREAMAGRVGSFDVYGIVPERTLHYTPLEVDGGAELATRIEEAQRRGDASLTQYVSCAPSTIRLLLFTVFPHTRAQSLLTDYDHLSLGPLSDGYLPKPILAVGLVDRAGSVGALLLQRERDDASLEEVKSAYRGIHKAVQRTCTAHLSSVDYHAMASAANVPGAIKAAWLDFGNSAESRVAVRNPEAVRMFSYQLHRCD